MRKYGKNACLLAMACMMTLMPVGNAYASMNEPGLHVGKTTSVDTKEEKTENFGPGLRVQDDQLQTPTGSGVVGETPSGSEAATNEAVSIVTGQGNVVVEKLYGKQQQIINISMHLDGISGSISYGVYVNHGGFLPWRGDGNQTGGTEDSTYIEAIQVAITGEAGELYDVYYRGHSAKAGLHGWAKNEELMGTIDRGDWLTDLEVVLVTKGAGAPGSQERRFFSNYSEYIRISQDGTTCKNLDGSGYNGWADHDRARYYFVNGQAVTGWQYIDGLKFYFNESGALIMDVDDLIGAQSKYQIRVNKEMNCLTVYAAEGDSGFIIPVKSMLTSVGDDTPVGTFHTPEKYRWRLMVNDTYTQYATRIIAGKGFLFHSITYDGTNLRSLITPGYNNLGVSRSLGCVRLSCGNAKWIYDRCAIGTEVVIYEDSTTPGPFFKPYQVWIPLEQTWDPTDPSIA